MVHHLGRIQDCRVFMIRGVRRLLGEGSATSTFSEQKALSTIHDQFDAYRQLFIERREGGDLNESAVLEFLIRRDVVRMGVDLRCPSCELVFWRSVDELRVVSPCEYCGESFSCVDQLREKHPWRYRRSGLFGRDDHQEGAIPVLVTLRCLDTILSSGISGDVFATGFDLRPKGSKINGCEIDLLYIHQATDGTELAIGECKAANRIDSNDVGNMRAVAAAMGSRRMKVFVIFAKMVPFTSEEIAVCKPPDGLEWPYRTILLGPDELEVYDYRLTANAARKRQNIALGLEGLAELTHVRYFTTADGPSE
jgi:hypothetical protein